MIRTYDRYVVIKMSDANKCLTREEQKELIRLGMKFQKYRRETSREWECVVVEHDWPEYEPVWDAIERRVDGCKPLPPMTQDVKTLVDKICKAVLSDEISEGCDISAGLFGPAFSALVYELAGANKK